MSCGCKSQEPIGDQVERMQSRRTLAVAKREGARLQRNSVDDVMANAQGGTLTRRPVPVSLTGRPRTSLARLPSKPATMRAPTLSMDVVGGFHSTCRPGGLFDFADQFLGGIAQAACNVFPPSLRNQWSTFSTSPGGHALQAAATLLAGGAPLVQPLWFLADVVSSCSVSEAIRRQMCFSKDAAIVMAAALPAAATVAAITGVGLPITVVAGILTPIAVAMVPINSALCDGRLPSVGDVVGAFSAAAAGGAALASGNLDGAMGALGGILTDAKNLGGDPATIAARLLALAHSVGAAPRPTLGRGPALTGHLIQLGPAAPPSTGGGAGGLLAAAAGLFLFLK